MRDNNDNYSRTNHSCALFYFCILPRTRSLTIKKLSCHLLEGYMGTLQKLWHCPLHSHAIILDNSMNSFLLFYLNEIFVSDITNLNTGKPFVTVAALSYIKTNLFDQLLREGYATVPPRVFFCIFWLQYRSMFHIIHTTTTTTWNLHKFPLYLFQRKNTNKIYVK